MKKSKQEISDQSISTEDNFWVGYIQLLPSQATSDKT